MGECGPIYSFYRRGNGGPKRSSEKSVIEPEQGSGPQPELLPSLIFANNKKTIWINLNHLVLLYQNHANSLSSTSLPTPYPPKVLENLQAFMQMIF